MHPFRRAKKMLLYISIISSLMLEHISILRKERNATSKDLGVGAV